MTTKRYATLPMQKLIVFDLNGTLAKRKAPLDAEMPKLLTAGAADTPEAARNTPVLEPIRP